MKYIATLIIMLLSVVVFPVRAYSSALGTETLRREVDKLREDLNREIEHRKHLEQTIEELNAPKNEERKDDTANESSGEEADSEKLLGDMGFKNPGKMEFTGGVTATAQGVTGARSDTDSDRTDASYSADVQFIYNYEENYYLVMTAATGAGKGSNDGFSTDIAPNYDAYRVNSFKGDEGVKLPQVYLEGLFMDRTLIFNIGKMDPGSFYDDNAFASDETSRFMAGAFVRASGVVGHPLDHYYGPTARFLYNPSPLLEVEAIYAHSEMEDLGREPVLVFQLALKPTIKGYSGSYRVYATHDGRDYKTFSGDSKSDMVYGVSFDQYIKENVGIFGRYSTHDDTIAANRVTSMASGGFTLNGGLWSRSSDIVGLGYAQLYLNGNLNLQYSGGQQLWELYYNLRINPLISLTADLQFHNSLPREKDRQAMVAGLRARLDF